MKKIIIAVSSICFLYGLTYIGLRASHQLVYRVTWNNSIDYCTGEHDTSVRIRDVEDYCFPQKQYLITIFKPLALLELSIRPNAEPLPKYSPQKIAERQKLINNRKNITK